MNKNLRKYKYEIGGYSGDQLEPLVDAMIRDADAHWMGREPLKEVVSALAHKLGEEYDTFNAKAWMRRALQAETQRDELLSAVKEACSKAEQ